MGETPKGMRASLISCFTLFMIVLCLCWTPTTHAGWTSVGPNTTRVWPLAIDPVTPTTLYAGTYGYGVYKSINGGTKWTAFKTGLPASSQIYSLAINPVTPTTLYAGTNMGVYKNAAAGNAANHDSFDDQKDEEDSEGNQF